MSDKERADALFAGVVATPGTAYTQIEAAFAAIRAEEREACAKLAYGFHSLISRDIAQAIRDRTPEREPDRDERIAGLVGEGKRERADFYEGRVVSAEEVRLDVASGTGSAWLAAWWEKDLRGEHDDFGAGLGLDP